MLLGPAMICVFVFLDRVVVSVRVSSCMYAYTGSGLQAVYLMDLSDMTRLNMTSAGMLVVCGE